MHATEIRDGVRGGSLKATDVVRDTITRVTADECNAIVHVFPDAPDRARAIDDAIKAGRDPGPLAGVPVAIKDNLAIGPTTCGSRILDGYVSPYVATCVQRLIDAGAIPVCKTNLDEFAMGSSTEHSVFGPTLNPLDHERVPGGSSGGSAACVASGIVPLALGSDTGGSIRQPASFCGVIGFKPTYGAVSRYGLVAFASSLDQVGPFARTIDDVEAIMGVIAGFDSFDATSSERPLEAPTSEGMTIGVPRLDEFLNDETGPQMEEAKAHLEARGATLVEIDLPHIRHGIAAYYIIAPAEASSNLARFDGVRYGRRAEAGDLDSMYARTRSEGFGAEVRRRILLGTHVLSSGYHDAFYMTALKVRRLIKGDFDRAFDRGVDAVLMPTAPGPAFHLGSLLDDPWSMYMQDVFTVGANLSGLPAISMPFGESGGMPLGIQLVGRAMGDRDLLRVARAFE